MMIADTATTAVRVVMEMEVVAPPSDVVFLYLSPLSFCRVPFPVVIDEVKSVAGVFFRDCSVY